MTLLETSMAFSRFPSDEVFLFRTLAKENLLPLKAWDINSNLISDRDYFDLRLQQAKKLGLTFAHRIARLET